MEFLQYLQDMVSELFDDRRDQHNFRMLFLAKDVFDYNLVKASMFRRNIRPTDKQIFDLFGLPRTLLTPDLEPGTMVLMRVDKMCLSSELFISEQINRITGETEVVGNEVQEIILHDINWSFCAQIPETTYQKLS